MSMGIDRGPTTEDRSSGLPSPVCRLPSLVLVCDHGAQRVHRCDHDLDEPALKSQFLVVVAT